MVATTTGLYVLTANPPQLALRDTHGAPRLVQAPAERLRGGRRSGQASGLGSWPPAGPWLGNGVRQSDPRAAGTSHHPELGERGVAFRGRLWLASDAGVYVVSGTTRPAGCSTRLVRYTYAVAADPARGRVWRSRPDHRARRTGSMSPTSMWARRPSADRPIVTRRGRWHGLGRRLRRRAAHQAHQRAGPATATHGGAQGESGCRRVAGAARPLGHVRRRGVVPRSTDRG